MGNTRATVSDANAVLGRLDADHFLGGDMTIASRSSSNSCRAAQLRINSDLSLEATAQGILDVANVNIDRALRRVSVARGYDPREFTLVTFGGAGALHACAIADRLEIPRVLIPRYPGVLCAYGLLVADVALDYSRSVLGAVTESTSHELEQHLNLMIAQADTDLDDEGIIKDNRVYSASLDLRYQGQAYELNIPFNPKDDIVTIFHSFHKKTYGHNLPNRPIEVVNLRLQAVGIVEHPRIEKETSNKQSSTDNAYLGEKRTTDGTALSLYDRDKLLPGVEFTGSALIFQLDSTIYLADGWTSTD